MASISQRQIAYATTLLASATKIASGNSQATSVDVRDTNAGIIFELDVTAAATLVGDTLDVAIQTTVDGTNWVDVVAFTQVLGNGGTKRFYAKVSATEPQAMFADATALTAGNLRHLIGDQWVVKWTIVNNSAPSFTFSVTAIPI